MSVALANVSILTDTTQSMVEKINKLTFSYSTDAITANTTLGVTGTVAAPRNARLHGSFAANTVNSHVFRTESGNFVANSTLVAHGLFTANTTTISLGSAQLIANSTAGSNNQVLSSAGPGQPAFWKTISGTGTVTSIVAGDGLNGGNITSANTISVKPADTSLIVTSAGVQVNAVFVAALSSNASTLLGKTWASPASIGSSAANSASFSSANAASFGVSGSFTANSSGTFSSNLLEASSNSAQAFRVKANSTNVATIQFTSGAGSEYANLKVDSSGLLTYTQHQNVKALGVGTGVSTNVDGEIRASGNITAYYTSDQRLKTNIKKIESALDKVQSIGGYTFDWSDDVLKSRGGEDGYFVRSHDVGVIAQQIESVLPEAVVERSDGFKAVRYELLVPLLIEAIKELSSKVDK